MQRTNHRLPDEILTEIFSRIPTKSVGKFKCLSKTWYTIFSTPHFINSHLSCKTNKESLILLTPSNSLHVITPPVESSVVSKKLEMGNTWSEVVGSCNGLVLLLDSKKEMFLVNPTTREQFKVANLRFDSEKLPVTVLPGFGYDSSSDDYKILMLSYYDDDENVGSFYTIVDLYSMNFGVWRRIDGFPNCVIPVMSCGAFANGSINWFAKSNSGKPRAPPFVIVSFDLTYEIFSEYASPANVYDGRNAFCRVLAHGGCLCLIDSLSSGNMDIWVMKEYGLEDSWTKLTSVDAKGKWDLATPLCFGNEETEIVFLTYEEVMVVCNLEESMIKGMVVNEVVAGFRDGFTFMDSLVSPTPRRHTSS